MKRVLCFLLSFLLIFSLIDLKVFADEQPGTFSITSPGSGSVIDSDFKVKWSESSGADYYTISIKNLDTGAYVTELEEVYGTSYSVSYSSLSPGCSYRIGLVSYSPSGVTRNGGTVDFRVADEQPGSFSITAPSSGSTITSDFTVSWSNSSKAAYYTISIKNLNTGGYVTELEEVYGTSYSVRFNRLESGCSYRIGVVAYSNSGVSRNGGTVEFSVGGNRPGEFYFQGPSNGSAFEEGTKVTLQWSASANAEYYVVNVRDLSTDSLVVSNADVGGNTSYTINANVFSAGHQYRAAVKSINAYGERSGGEITFSFNKKAAAPSYVDGMNGKFTISEGSKLTLNGTIYSGGGEKLTTVTADVTDGAQSTGRVSKSPNANSYNLSDITLDTSSLKAGSYTVRVWGKTASYDAASTAGTATLIVEKKAIEPSYVKELSAKFTIAEGEKVTLNGTIYGGAGEKLITVTADVTDGSVSTGRVSKSPNANSYNLSGIILDTSSLKAGSYTIRVWGKTASYDAASTAATATLIIEKKVVEPSYVKGLNSKFTITEGEKVTLNGTIYGGTGETLTTVTADITDGSKSTGRVSKSPNEKSYDLLNITLDSSSLKAGSYTIRVWGKTASYDAASTAGTATLVIETKMIESESEESSQAMPEEEIVDPDSEQATDEEYDISTDDTVGKPHVVGMNEKYEIEEGSDLRLSGIIKSYGKLTKVTADITDNRTSYGRVSVEPYGNRYDLSKIVINTASVGPGIYKIRIWGATQDMDVVPIAGEATLIIKSKVIEGAGAAVKFDNEYAELFAENKISLSWNADLTAQQKKEVVYTVIQFYRWGLNDKPVMVVNKQFKGIVTNYSCELDGGIYGVEVVYYTKDLASVVASGQTRIKTPLSISKFFINDVIQGNVASIKGEVKTYTNLSSIECKIYDSATQKEELQAGVKFDGDGSDRYVLSGSYLDNRLYINNLTEGKKKAVLTAVDISGAQKESIVNFTVNPKPKENEKKDEAQETVSDNVQSELPDKFDIDLFLANPHVKYDGYYSVDGKKYKAYVYSGYETYFFDDKMNVVTDYELINKLGFTCNVQKVMTEPTTIEYLKGGTTSLRNLTNSINSIAGVSMYVETVGAVAVDGLTGNVTGMATSVGKYLIADAKDIETYLVGMELYVLNLLTAKMERYCELAGTDTFRDYDEAVRFVKTVTTITSCIEPLQNSLCEAYEWNEVNSIFDKLVWWGKKTWSGFSKGKNVDEATEVAMDVVFAHIDVISEAVQDPANTEAEELYEALKLLTFDFYYGDVKVLTELKAVDITENVIRRAKWVLPYVQVNYFMNMNTTKYGNLSRYLMFDFLTDIQNEVEPRLKYSETRLALNETSTLKVIGYRKGAKIKYRYPKNYLSVTPAGVVKLINDNCKEKKLVVTVIISQDGVEYEEKYTVKIQK